jgi:hypothetical protein
MDRCHNRDNRSGHNFQRSCITEEDDGGIHVIDKERTQSRPPGLVLERSLDRDDAGEGTQGRQAGQHQALPTAVFN